MNKDSIVAISKKAKDSLLKLCDQEIQKRNNNNIDVDIEYVKGKEKKSIEFWKNLVAGFIASAITIAFLSYSFIIFGIVYLLVNNS